MCRSLQRVAGSAVFLAAFLLGCAEDVAPTPGSGPLTISSHVEHLGSVDVREPMMVEHPDGALFVAGFTQAVEETGQPPKLFRSIDDGASWEPVNVGGPAQGAVGNSDVDLAVAPDGTLYFLTMGYDRAERKGTHVAIGVSPDVGETWTWAYLSQDWFDDRPWIVVAPDGVAHVIWNDGAGVCYAVSSDGGVTWTERPRIHPEGSSSHLAVGPVGELAVRITPVSASGNQYHPGVDLIAVSLDGGSTWEKLTPPGNRVWDDPKRMVPRWVEPLAWDAEGALYYLWSEGTELLLGRSRDQGETWEAWPIANSEDQLYFPFLTARSPGELAATWFSGFGENLYAHIALIDANRETEPSVRRIAPFQVEAWRQVGESLMRDTAGEYLPVMFLSRGELCIVTTIQNAPENRHGFAWTTVSY